MSLWIALVLATFNGVSALSVVPSTINVNINPGVHTIALSYGSSCAYGYGGIAFTLTNDGTHIVDLQTDNTWGSVAWWSSGIPSYLNIWNNTYPSGSYTTSLSHQFTASLIVPTDALIDPVANDNCISMETNTQCSLQNEVVDGVQTFLNYNPTGLAPISSCRNFTGQVQTFNVCHNWWSKSRTYYCKTTTTFDFSAIKARSANISTTSTAGGGDVTFQDKTPDGSGGWLYSDNTFTADTSSGPAGCMTACKTKKPSINTQASLSGNTAQTNTSTAAWEFSYKTCTSSSGAFVCPLSSGEQIVTDCQCINDFAESATIMQTLNDASQGMICSSGTPTTAP